MAQKSYKPTQAMINNAKRGLAARKKAPDSQKGGFDAKEAKEEGVGSGVARARDIINGSLSLESVKRMYSFLSRAQTYYKPKERTAGGNLTPGTQAYLLWGGSAALAWSRKILREEGIVKSYKAEISEVELNTEEVIKGFHFGIEKAVNEEKRLATFLVLEPQDDDGTTNDLHGDWYDEDTVEQACHSFNTLCMKANFLHRMPTDVFTFVESYITKTEMILGDQYIKKGSWLATIKVEETEAGEMIWQGIKDGKFNGLSIQALGTVEYLEDEDE